MRVESRPFQAHSKVLSASSPFFERLVSNGEAFSHSIELSTTSASAFEALLEFFYTGECSFPAALLVPVLETAHHLRAQAPLNSALQQASERIAPSNCVDMHAFATRLSLCALRQKCEAMISAHFDTIRTHQSFVNLGEQFLCDLLASDALGVSREEDAFDAAA